MVPPWKCRVMNKCIKVNVNPLFFGERIQTLNELKRKKNSRRVRFSQMQTLVDRKKRVKVTLTLAKIFLYKPGTNGKYLVPNTEAFPWVHPPGTETFGSF